MLSLGAGERLERQPLDSAPGPARADGGSTDNVRLLHLSPRDASHALQVAASTGEAAARRTAEAVQRLIVDVAMRFISIEPEAIDGAVVYGLSRIAETLQLDRASVWWKAVDDASEDISLHWLNHPSSTLPVPSEIASIPSVASRLEAGEVAWFTRLDQVPHPVDRETFLRHEMRAAAVVPIELPGGVLRLRGVLAVSSSTEREWDSAVIDGLRLVAGLFGQALGRQASLTALQRAVDELRQLRQRLSEEHEQTATNGSAPAVSRPREHRPRDLCTRPQATLEPGTQAVIGQSAAIQQVLEQLQQVAATDSTVLLLGETGTGKELLARHLHLSSARRGRQMVGVNCSAIPSTLMESELFGREKGAFTGALARQIGRFELAHRSTIFLDEIGDLPAEVQVKLLRVLEERQIERLGSPIAIGLDVRIVAATHRNLEKLLADGSFREDLFYRLNVFPVQVPPLRDRAEDIPLLVWRFVDDFSKTFGKRVDAISRESMIALQRYSWPGNIRELRNVVERALIVATGPRLTIALPTSSRPTLRHGGTMAEVEKAHIRSVVESTCWRIRGSGGAAERLGLPPTTLETRMAKLGLARPRSA